MKETPLEKIWTKSFISISLTQFLLFTVFYALLTTLPIYVINDLDGTQSSAGLIVTFMLISAILIRPFTAKLLEVTGKKRGLVWSMILFTLTTCAYILMRDLNALFALRFVHGLSFGIVTTATGAIVADLIPSSRRGAGMGYFAMAMNLAVVAGPFVGLTLLQYISFQALFIILSICMIIGVGFSIAVQLDEEKVPVASNEKNSVFRLKLDDLFEKKAVPVTIISGLIGFSYASILSFVSVYAEELGLAGVASYFFLVFAIVMIAFRPYLGRAFDEKGAKVVLLPCMIIFAVGLALLGFTSTGFMLLLAAGLIGLGYGTLLPGFQALTIATTTKERSGHAMSTFFIFYDLGIAAGAFTWGIVSARFGFGNMYMLGAALVLMTTLLFYNQLKRKQGSVESSKSVSS